MRNLPPLDLLIPFEASARLGSFTRAAQELSVTQSAVSQRVRTLENILQTRLFLRHHRRIELTDEGRELFNGVKVALQHLSAAAQSIQRHDTRAVLKLAADSSIAALWLPERLKQFLPRPSALSIDLIVSDDEEMILQGDVVIVHGDGTWPGFVARRLFSDEVFAVCAPQYLARCPVSTPADLLTADLIDLDYKHWNWMNWGIWLTETGVDPREANIVMCTDSYPTQIAAARAGLGVALGWRHVVEADLRAGTLVQPMRECVETRHGYYVLLRQGAEERAHLLAKFLFDSVLR